MKKEMAKEEIVVAINKKFAAKKYQWMVGCASIDEETGNIYVSYYYDEKSICDEFMQFERVLGRRLAGKINAKYDTSKMNFFIEDGWYEVSFCLIER